MCDADSGEIVREGRAPHPDTTEIDPEVWWSALDQATADDLMRDVAAIAVGGQQHGMVLADDGGAPIRQALLWNDNRSEPQARDLIEELGGSAAWADATGVVPVASVTVTKLRWVADNEPETAAQARQVMLPRDWVTHRLRAGSGGPTTDRGDASGTGYWSARAGAYLPDLLVRAFGREIATPRVSGPSETVGETRAGAQLAPGTGDNMAAALALDLDPGDVVVSLGTSGTVFATLDRPTADPDGVVAGYADALGVFLPLACTLNAARFLASAVAMAWATLEDLDALAMCCDESVRAAPPRPPALRVPPWRGTLCGLGDAIDAVRGCGVVPRRVIPFGGAARSAAVQQMAAGLFGLPVEVPRPAEYVALGAARQAAWTLAGSEKPPSWPVESHRVEPSGSADAYHRVRTDYRAVLDRARPLLTERQESSAQGT